jgi:hypothetical protein
MHLAGRAEALTRACLPHGKVERCSIEDRRRFVLSA